MVVITVSKKAKDPSMKLVSIHINIYEWQSVGAELEAKATGFNLSEEVRNFLSERLPKNNIIRLEELKAKLDEAESIAAGLRASVKAIESNLELQKEMARQQFLEDNLDAYVLKRNFMMGKIPNNYGVFQFTDRDIFIADAESGAIKPSDPVEAFKKYRFKLSPTKNYESVRLDMQKEFENWLKSSDVKIEKKGDNSD